MFKYKFRLRVTNVYPLGTVGHSYRVEYQYYRFFPVWIELQRYSKYLKGFLCSYQLDEAMALVKTIKSYEDIEKFNEAQLKLSNLYPKETEPDPEPHTPFDEFI